MGTDRRDREADPTAREYIPLLYRKNLKANGVTRKCEMAVVAGENFGFWKRGRAEGRGEVYLRKGLFPAVAETESR